MDDETFYSACSRQHCMLGAASTSATLAWLFNTTAATTTHDLPYNLSALNPAAMSAWGDPRSIILEHTILPVFLPFQSAKNALEAFQAMESPVLGSLKYRLGLLTGRFGAEHPLKACSSCMAADLDTHGFAYWHLSHQYPGVQVCPVHCELLRESCCNRQWSRRLQWILPEESTLTPAHGDAPLGPSLRALEQLANAVLDLAVCGRTRQFNPDVVRALYRDALKVGSENLASSFSQHCALLQANPPLASLPSDPQQVPAFWTQLVRNRQGCSHPLKHLAVITWLYGSVSGFVEAYDRAVDRELTESLSQKVWDTVQVAEETVEPDRAITPSANRKPKVLKPNIRADILEHLSRGEEKNGICDAFGITVSTVNKLLRSEPEVHQSWLHERLISNVKEHRALWLAANSSYTERSPKDIRIRIPSVYAWLYRNDKEWLLSRTREMKSGRRGNNASVNWAQRDDVLLNQVKMKVHKLREGETGRKISRASLYLACPALASALEKRCRYPRTRAFLKTMR